jgi:hypothetical protein
MSTDNRVIKGDAVGAAAEIAAPSCVGKLFTAVDALRHLSAPPSAARFPLPRVSTRKVRGAACGGSTDS